MRRREFIRLVGGALAAPSIACAQTAKKIPTVAYLWHAANQKEESPYYEALLEGFSTLGYVDGGNFRLLHRFPNENPERFRQMAAELVGMNVDVLMGGALASSYLKDATKTIPIVFMFIPDPVGMKFVQSLARPGGMQRAWRTSESMLPVNACRCSKNLSRASHVSGSSPRHTMRSID